MASPPHRVSLVIAAFNAEDFIARAIRSVLCQTLVPQEIIVIDDGSTDGTARVAAAFGGSVRVIRQENAGPGAARNAGIRAATGELVAFLDADDELLPDMVASLSAALMEHETAAVASGAYLYENVGVRRRPEPGGVLGGRTVGLIRDFFETARHHDIANVGSVMARRRIVEQVGGFREDIRFGEDLDLWARLAGRHDWLFVDEPMFTYHHSQATSATLRTPESQKPVDFVMSEARMREHVREELWPGYRRYRRDLLLRQARTALSQGERSQSRLLLEAIAPAPVNVEWGITELLSRVGPLGPWSLHALAAARRLTHGRRGPRGSAGAASNGLGGRSTKSGGPKRL